MDIEIQFATAVWEQVLQKGKPSTLSLSFVCWIVWISACVKIQPCKACKLSKIEIEHIIPDLQILTIIVFVFVLLFLFLLLLLLLLLLFFSPPIVSYFPYLLLRRWRIICLWR